MIVIDPVRQDQDCERKTKISREFVFRAEGREFYWEDIIEAAKLRGDWLSLEAKVRCALSCLKKFSESGETLYQDLEEAMAAFRYERDLESAEDMEAWLLTRDLVVEDWSDFLLSNLLLQRWSGNIEQIILEHPVSDEEVARAIVAHGFCSGFFDNFAYEFAARVAVSEGAFAQEGRSANEIPFQALERAYQKFRRQNISFDILKQQTAIHGLEWIRLDLQWLTFASESSAREARTCITEDNKTLPEIATMIESDVDEARVFVSEIGPSLRPHFVSAQPGELLGPIANNDGNFTLYHVMHRLLPALTDAHIRFKAEQTFLDKLIEQKINESIQWGVFYECGRRRPSAFSSDHEFEHAQTGRA